MSCAPPTTPKPRKRHHATSDVMDDSLYFTEQHLATREMVRQFARDEVAPVAAKYDAEAKFPWDNDPQDGRARVCSAFRGPRSWAARGSTPQLHDRDPRAGEGRRVARDHDLRAHHARHVADRQLRHRRAAAALRPAPGQRPRHGRLRPHRAGRGQRRRRHAHHRRAQRRLLRPQRLQALHHARRRRRDLRRHGGDRARGRAPRASARSSSPSRRPISRRATRVGIGHEPSLPAMPGFRAGKKEDKLGWRASDTSRADPRGRRGPGREPARRRRRRASSTSCRRSTPGASASRRCRSASPRARSSRRCSTRARASSSASRSRTSRACSSSSRTWRRRSRPGST